MVGEQISRSKCVLLLANSFHTRRQRNCLVEVQAVSVHVSGNLALTMDSTVVTVTSDTDPAKTVGGIGHFKTLPGILKIVQLVRILLGFLVHDFL